MNVKQNFFLLAVLFFAFGCTTTKKTDSTKFNEDTPVLKFINVYEIPYNLTFNKTIVGGLSGIDYNNEKQEYYIISDDRSKINPARFYTAKINITKSGIDTVIFTDVNFLRQPNGEVYPNVTKDPNNTPDPESIRFNSFTKQLVWSNEGERNINKTFIALSNPSINVIDTSGNYISEYTIPNNAKMSIDDVGPRANSVFEGISFDKNGKKLYVSLECPLLQDGDEPDTLENNAITRFLVFDTKTKKNIAQYAYKLDAIAYPPKPATGFKTNGISEILWLSENKLLVMERSFSTGVFSNTIKIYLADFTNATDVSNISSLKNTSNYTLANKKLLLNLNSLKMYIDNVEGITFGPKLPNGNRSLILIADNNFLSIEQQQVFLFEVQE